MKSMSGKYAGFVLAVSAAILWGVSGACAQFLLQEKRIDIDWLVAVRLLLAGGLLLLYSLARGNAGIWKIWSTRRSAADLVIFSFLGMLAVQYTYFAAIMYSNAATGTVLQYLGPVFIAIYFAAYKKRLPSGPESLAIVLAFSGTLLLVTHGEFGTLQISGLALFWGISSAIALAFYTVYPVRLLKEQDSASMIGWSMVIGGLGFSLISKPWQVSGIWDMAAVMAAVFTILFGTLVAFYCYLAAVKRVGPQKTSLLACVEPLSAAVTAVLWLQIPFGLMDWIGSACIVATIFILSRK